VVPVIALAVYLGFGIFVIWKSDGVSGLLDC
jgi:hypothetical protein